MHKVQKTYRLEYIVHNFLISFDLQGTKFIGISRASDSWMGPNLQSSTSNNLSPLVVWVWKESGRDNT